VTKRNCCHMLMNKQHTSMSVNKHVSHCNPIIVAINTFPVSYSQKPTILRSIIQRSKTVCIKMHHLAHPACLPDGLYVLLAFFYLQKNLLVVDLWAIRSQELLEPFSPNFQSGLVELCKGLINPTFIWRPLKGRCHGKHF